MDRLTRCSYCGVEELIPFKCRYCGGFFCPEHRLPESHRCDGIVYARNPSFDVIREKYHRVYDASQKRFTPSFTKTEGLHLIIASAVVSLAGLGLVGWEALFSISGLMLIAGFTASFIGHELAHKYVAINKGFAAGFQLYHFGLLATVLTAVLPIPFKVIMPGAVVFQGSPTARDVGHVGVAGPLFNIFLAAVLTVVKYVSSIWLLAAIANINAFLAFFNLLPIPPLDGHKIITWSWKAWLASLIASLALMTLLRLF